MAKYFINIPPGLKPWEADNWRAVSSALNEVSTTAATVNNETTGLAAVKGKVRVDKNDSTPDWLDQKIVGGNDIDFVESTDGRGSREIKVHLNVYSDNNAPPTPTDNTLWYDKDEPEPEYFDIGDNAADTDFKLRFLGETNDGIITWWEDEDYFSSADDFLMESTEKLYFRDTAISINSEDDGHLDLTADTSIDLNGVTLATDKIAFTQTDLNEYIDSLADGYIDYRATTGHRFGDGTNYTMLSAGGTLTQVGTARVWKSVDINPQLVKLPGANPPAEDNIGGFSFHRYNRATEESVYYTWIVPDDFATGDASLRCFYGFVVAHPPVSPAGAENVRMGFEYKRITEGAVFDFSTGTTSGYLDETIAADETANIVHLTGYGTCTTTGWVPHDKILFRFYRDATATEDTYDNEASADDNDVWVKAYHLEYLADKLGGASS
jgi:hypothetical protein